MRSKLMLSVLSLFILSSCSLFRTDDESPSLDDPTEQVDEIPIEETNGESEENTDEPNDGDEVSNSQINQDITAWIPRLDNVVYSYEGTGSEFSSFTWNPQFNKDDYYQIVRNNGGTVMAEVYEYSENEVTRKFTRGETYFRDNFSEIGSVLSETEEETYLKTPIEVGSSWDGSDGMYEITSIDKEIIVPAGTYKTIEITISYSDSISKRYYAEDVGLVYEVHNLGDLIVESRLSSIQTDISESLMLNVYVPDEQAMGMDTVATVITLETNDPARIAIQGLLTGQHPDYPEINILPPETTIQYLFLNNDNIVEVDLSEEFETNMNAGSTGELFYIYTLTNTLSRYYGANEVLLTIDGEPFEGGHLVAEEGELLEFNEEMVNP